MWSVPETVALPRGAVCRLLSSWGDEAQPAAPRLAQGEARNQSTPARAAPGLPAALTPVLCPETPRLPWRSARAPLTAACLSHRGRGRCGSPRRAAGLRRHRQPQAGPRLRLPLLPPLHRAAPPVPETPPFPSPCGRGGRLWSLVFAHPSLLLAGFLVNLRGDCVLDNKARRSGKPAISPLAPSHFPPCSRFHSVPHVSSSS